MKSKKSLRLKSCPLGRRLTNCFIGTHSRSTSCRHPSWSKIRHPCGWMPILDPCNGAISPLSSTTCSILALLRAWDRVSPVTPAPITITLKGFLGTGVLIVWIPDFWGLLAHSSDEANCIWNRSEDSLGFFPSFALVENMYDPEVCLAAWWVGVPNATLVIRKAPASGLFLIGALLEVGKLTIRRCIDGGAAILS